MLIKVHLLSRTWGPRTMLGSCHRSRHRPAHVLVSGICDGSFAR